MAELNTYRIILPNGIEIELKAFITISVMMVLGFAIILMTRLRVLHLFLRVVQSLSYEINRKRRFIQF